MHDDTTRKLTYYAKISYQTMSLCLPLEYWKRSGNLDLHHNLQEIYVNYLMKTKGELLNEHPEYMQVTTDSKCNNALSDRIAIEWSKRDTIKKVQFGVCLHKALFNINDPQLLVDWIEIHKAMGVELLTVYLEKVPESIADAVKPYVEEGLLHLLDWNIGKRTRDYGQSGVMTECHYHNMYRVDYLGMYDLDEIVIPQKYRSWKEMFDEIKKKTAGKFEDIASFKLIGLRWHNSNSTQNLLIGNKKQLCDHVNLPFYFRKTMRDNHCRDHPKIILRPLLTTCVQVHDIGGNMPGKKRVARVSQDIATCHHYREPDTSNNKDIRYSDVMLRYKEEILKGINKSMCP